MMALGFVLPLSTAASYIIALLIILLWLARGDFSNDWKQLRNNPVALSVTGFVLLHIVGLLWTTDIKNGIYVLKKESVLLLLPILMLFAKKEHIDLYINTFLIAMTASMSLSFAVWFEVIPPAPGIKTADPTPFMSHISYTPYLTIAVSLILYRLLFSRDIAMPARVLYVVMAVSMSINIFITRGRAGQIMFFAMIGIVIFQYNQKNLIRAATLSFFGILTAFLLSYSTSDVFRSRLHEAVNNINTYESKKTTDVGLRIAFTLNSLEIIKKHPLSGVGTGDFNIEYEKVNALHSPDMPATGNPHNMYVLALVQFGIIGLLSLLALLYTQILQAGKSNNLLRRNFGIALPVLFALIMFSDSYLRGHFTTMLFAYFSSFIYKDYEDDRPVSLPVEKPRLPM